MPLRCLDPIKRATIHSFDLTSQEWDQLAVQNRRQRHLRLPCCSAEVTLRRSRRGTQFFAHKAVGECVTAPETEAHLRLKQLAVEVARQHGWTAETEVGGCSPTGEPWQADVLATKGTAHVAVEIQWSGQTPQETARRQARYAASGVRCLWLMRRMIGPPVGDIPAAQVITDEARGFMVTLASASSQQSLPVDQFMAAVFKGRLKFGLPIEAMARASFEVGTAPCWSCGAFTEIVTDIRVETGPHTFSFSVADSGDWPALFDALHHRFAEETNIRSIKRRYGRTRRRSYLSNGCAHCDALFGEYYEHDAEERKPAFTVVFHLDERWQRMLSDQDDVLSWGVFEFARDGAGTEHPAPDPTH